MVWGHFESLHWVFDPDRWEEALSHGNGYDRSGDEAGQIRVQGLLHVGMSLKTIGGESYSAFFEPYTSFCANVKNSGVDLKIFTYDWRLSCTANAAALAERINRWWWPGHTPRTVAPEEKVTIIGHSLGGLVGRYYIENAALEGCRYVRQLVTVGTPHLGAPEAYTHLIGETRPFELRGVIRVLSDLLAASSGDSQYAPAGLMPLKMQKNLMRHYASAFELLPRYDFVRITGGLQHIEDTERSLPSRRQGSKLSTREVLEAFRVGLVESGQLDCFLENQELRYHFLAGDGLETVQEYDSTTRKVIRGPDGDGTVPSRSAMLAPYSSTARHITVERIFREGLASDEIERITVGGDPRRGIQVRKVMEPYDHMDLMRARTVERYCIQQTLSPILKVRSRPLGPPPNGNLALQNTLDWLQGAKPATAEARMLRKQSNNRYVVSITTLDISDSDRFAALDLNLSTRNGRENVAIPGLSKPGEVHSVGGRRFVYIAAYKASGYGGLLFLPERCGSEVNIVTWNVGVNTPDVEFRCSSQTHAERQFTHWFEQQDVAWIKRIKRINIQNRSTRKGSNPGPSPCHECSVELAGFLRDLHRKFSIKPNAAISWLYPFVGSPRCSSLLDFSKRSYREMKSAGWSLQPSAEKDATL
jgi:hypothetical protein